MFFVEGRRRGRLVGGGGLGSCWVAGCGDGVCGERAGRGGDEG